MPIGHKFLPWIMGSVSLLKPCSLWTAGDKWEHQPPSTMSINRIAGIHSALQVDFSSHFSRGRSLQQNKVRWDLFPWLSVPPQEVRQKTNPQLFGQTPLGGNHLTTTGSLLKACVQMSQNIGRNIQNRSFFVNILGVHVLRFNFLETRRSCLANTMKMTFRCLTTIKTPFFKHGFCR